MRCLSGIVLVCCLLSIGCINRPGSYISRIRPFHKSPAEDELYLHYVIIERNLADVDIDLKIWEGSIDEMVIPIDQRQVVGKNGFRVGITGRMLPPELQTMINRPLSEGGIRYQSLIANREQKITINGPLAHASFTRGLSTTTESGEQVECKFAITAKVMENGKIHVKFDPEVTFKPDDFHRSVLGRALHRIDSSTKIHSTQDQFEVDISPNDYLVIGTYSNLNHTLGSTFFTMDHPKQPIQKLLILRVGQLKGPDPISMPIPQGIAKSESKTTAPPLAQQAGMSILRSCSP